MLLLNVKIAITRDFNYCLIKRIQIKLTASVSGCTLTLWFISLVVIGH